MGCRVGTTDLYDGTPPGFSHASMCGTRRPVVARHGQLHRRSSSWCMRCFWTWDPPESRVVETCRCCGCTWGPNPLRATRVDCRYAFACGCSVGIGMHGFKLGWFAQCSCFGYGNGMAQNVCGKTYVQRIGFPKTM